MGNKSDDIFEEIGLAMVASVVGAALLFLVIVGYMALPLIFVVLLLWHHLRYGKAARARRELAELKELHTSTARLATSIEIPNVDEMTKCVVGHLDEVLVDGRALLVMFYGKIEVTVREVIAHSGLEVLPDFDAKLLEKSVDARNDFREKLYRLQRTYQSGEAGVDAVYAYIVSSIEVVLKAMPTGDTFAPEPNDYDFTIELIDVLADPKTVTEALLYLPFEWNTPTVESMQQSSLMRMAHVTGKRVAELLENPQRLPKPSEAKGSGHEVLQTFLCDSPFLPLLSGRVAYRIPAEARFEHTHILAGTGHGKTQLIQRLVREDLQEIYFWERKRQAGVVTDSPRSLVVLDGQGDMIDAIARRHFCAPDGPLAGKVLIIDPTDIHFPLALNMFDIGQNELEHLDPVTRELVFNGTVELYVYLFGALLSAELTQKQDVLFRYLARLMLVIPQATLNTLRDVIEDGEKYQQHIEKLDHQSQEFFRTQFFGSTEFKETKKQILRRLWGILSIQPLANMFNSPVNKVDLFAELQEGKIILINTAKEFLKTDGARIFGRFWIALLAQAALRRAAIPASARVDTHVYIDEAHEYIDDKVEEILNQARKYRIALHLAHQNLGQLSPTQRATLASSTAIKMVGGVSDADARTCAGELRVDADSIKATRKRGGGTEFMTYVRNHTDSAIKLNVGFGTLERMDEMSDADYDELRKQIRERYATPQPETDESQGGAGGDDGFELGEHEAL